VAASVHATVVGVSVAQFTHDRPIILIHRMTCRSGLSNTALRGIPVVWAAAWAAAERDLRRLSD
jgi:hypothetical protein